MLTRRDYQIINFIDEFKAVRSDQIQKLFGLSPTVANRRLTEICKQKKAKRHRNAFTMHYLYYTTDKPTDHKLLVTEFYTRLVEMDGEFEEFETEYTIGNLRADAFFIYKYKGFKYFIFLEVQLSNSPVDIAKYERLYRSGYPWPCFPRVVAVTDRALKTNTDLHIVKLPTTLDGIEKVFEIKQNPGD